MNSLAIKSLVFVSIASIASAWSPVPQVRTQQPVQHVATPPKPTPTPAPKVTPPAPKQTTHVLTVREYDYALLGLYAEEIKIEQDLARAQNRPVDQAYIDRLTQAIYAGQERLGLDVFELDQPYNGDVAL